MLPPINTAKITPLYISKTMPKTAKLSMAKVTLSTCPVRNDCIRLWSATRCSKSPNSLDSKKDIGNFISLIKKSLTRLMLIRMDMCSNSHLRMKSVAVRPATIIISPTSISHISPMSCRLIPLSTMNCVRKGIASCNRQPRARPRAI